MKKILLFMVLFAISANISSAQDVININTNHPDLQIKLKRCIANGETVVIDMVFTNTSDYDADMRIVLGNEGTIIHDDEGNEYKGGDDGPICVKIANRKPEKLRSNFTLISGVPTKVQWTITGVPISVESIARIRFGVKSDAFSLHEKNVTIRNIPISRN